MVCRLNGIYWLIPVCLFNWKGKRMPEMNSRDRAPKTPAEPVKIDSEKAGRYQPVQAKDPRPGQGPVLGANRYQPVQAKDPGPGQNPAKSVKAQPYQPVQAKGPGPGQVPVMGARHRYIKVGSEQLEKAKSKLKETETVDKTLDWAKKEYKEDAFKDGALMQERTIKSAKVERVVKDENPADLVNISDFKTALSGRKKEGLKAVTALMQKTVSKLDPKSDMAWALTLKTEKELIDTFTHKLGPQKPAVFKAMLKGIEQGLPNRIDGSTIEIDGEINIHTEKPTPMKVASTIVIDGEQFGKPTYLTQGGFGLVLSYTNLNNPDKKVIVKQPLASDQKTHDDLRREAVDEINAHREILNKDNPEHIIGLHGALRGLDNQLYIVQEFAAKGDLNGINQKLKQALSEGTINQSTHDLLSKHLAKGVIEGMRYIQEDRQMIHFDTKLPNMLLSADGIVKQTDFGLTKVGTEVGLSARLADNPIYQAPELMDADKIARTNAEASVKVKYGLDPVPQQTKPQQPKDEGNLAEMATYLTALKERKEFDYYESLVEQEIKSNPTTIDRKSDTWAVGVAVHELFIGNINKLNWDKSFVSEITAKLTEFRLNPETSHIREPGLRMSISTARAMLETDLSAIPLFNTDDFKTTLETVANPPGPNARPEEIRNFAQESKKFDDMVAPMKGVGSVDKLINGLMHPNPDKRITLEAALQMSVFDDERIDSDEVKKLLMAVTSNPPDQLIIDSLSEKLSLK
jgi:serine/threonine protein kinase